MKPFTMIGVALLCFSLMGCRPYADYQYGQNQKAQTAINQERAEIAKLYRQCLEKYQNDPPQAKAQCEHYTQSLQAIDVRGMK